MKSGIELIAQERKEQIEKHGRTILEDIRLNTSNQLSEAASFMASEDWGCNDVEDIIEDYCPTGWDKEIWGKMLRKPHFQRKIIAAALLAADIDRDIAIENNAEQLAELSKP